MKASPHRPTKALIHLGSYSTKYSASANGGSYLKVRSSGQWSRPMPMVMELLPLRTAIQDDVDGFCVSNIDEAIELR